MPRSFFEIYLVNLKLEIDNKQPDLKKYETINILREILGIVEFDFPFVFYPLEVSRLLRISFFN